MTKPHKFRSKFEGRVWDAIGDAQDRVEYEPRHRKVSYILAFNYLPDFVVDGRIIIETKGRLTYEDRRKMLAAKEQHPDLDIRFVFQRAANVIRKGSLVTYAQWAETNGFPWAEGTIPQEWLDA